MAFYLIDFENTKNISSLSDLSDQDTIIFFYSQNANSLSFDLHIELNKSTANKKYFLAQCGGKNALDFQLSSYVGYLISAYPNEKIIIISNDKGFGYLLSFWQEQGFTNIEIRKNISENPIDSKDVVENNKNVHSQNPIQTQVETIQDVLKKNIPSLNISINQIVEIEKIVNGFKTKQAINNNLMKLLRDSDKVGKITKVIKPYLNKKK